MRPAEREPVEPPPTRWVFGDLTDADPDDDLVGVGADLEPGTVLAAYRRGMFPMPVGEEAPMGWWSPVRRGVLRPADLNVSRSLRRACRDYEVRVDTAFDDVLDACADPARPHGWIDRRITDAYRRLHRLGWAHSVEAWRDGRLEGGLYGLAIGGLFAGESMFHRARDASKVALVGLVDALVEERDEHAEHAEHAVHAVHAEHVGPRLVDVQWRTDHLASLGVVEVDRVTYLGWLPELVVQPPPRALLRAGPLAPVQPR